ncbi:MAG: DUF5655 domain-containing protein [Thermoplasmatota archaeon]
MTEWTCPRCRQVFLARNARHSCDRQAIEEFFGPYPHGLPLFEAVLRAVRAFGPVEPAATKTQVSFRARTRFAWLWIPQMALKRGPPDVYLTFDLSHCVDSPRIKEAIQVRPGRWVHHLRLASPRDVDAEVKAWLREAYEAVASPPPRRGRA